MLRPLGHSKSHRDQHDTFPARKATHWARGNLEQDRDFPQQQTSYGVYMCCRHPRWLAGTDLIDMCGPGYLLHRWSPSQRLYKSGPISLFGAMCRRTSCSARHGDRYLGYTLISLGRDGERKGPRKIFMLLFAFCVVWGPQKGPFGEEVEVIAVCVFLAKIRHLTRITAITRRFEETATLSQPACGTQGR